jgi:hypothetical protein
MKLATGKPEGERFLGRYWRRWDDSIKTYFKKLKYEGVDWILQFKDRVQ